MPKNNSLDLAASGNVRLFFPTCGPTLGLSLPEHVPIAGGHTATNTPDLFRTPELTVAGPGQYWGGGPPGEPFGCC